MPDVSNNVDEIMCIPAVGILSYHWFLTVFVTNIHDHDTLLQIWDIFFVRGARSIFQVAVSIFQGAATALATATEMQEVSAAINDSMNALSHDSLIDAVLGSLSDVVTEERIKEKRNIYLKQLKQEEENMKRRLNSFRMVKENENNTGEREGDGSENESSARKKRPGKLLETPTKAVPLSGGERRRSIAYNMKRASLITEGNTAPNGDTATTVTLDHTPSVPSTSSFVLDDLLQIEKVALVELTKVVLLNRKQQQPTQGGTTSAGREENIDGRTLCVVDEETFAQIWPVACQSCVHGDQWLAWHTPREIFEAFAEPKRDEEEEKTGTTGTTSKDPTVVSEMVVDFRDILCGLSVFCDGSSGDRVSKLRFIYSVYDTDRNQTLDFDELHDLMSAVYSMFMNFEKEEVFEAEVKHFVKLVFSKLGNGEGEQCLNFSQFREVSVMQPLILQYLADDGGRTTGGSNGGGGESRRNSRATSRRSQSGGRGGGESPDMAQNNHRHFRHCRTNSYETLQRTSFARGELRDSSESLNFPRVGEEPPRTGQGGDGGGEEPPTRLHGEVVQLAFVQAMGVGGFASGESGGGDEGMPKGAKMSDYYAMLKKLNEACFELEQCKQELTIEKRVHKAMDNELEEMEMKWKEATRLLVEEKANSKLNKEMLHEILNAKGESPLKKNNTRTQMKERMCNM
jgi:Ca2+-binding EF-hand superfamily protein